MHPGRVTLIRTSILFIMIARFAHSFHTGGCPNQRLISRNHFASVTDRYKSHGHQSLPTILMANIFEEQTEFTEMSSSLQRKLQYQTLSRITIPSIALASICYVTFPPISMGLAAAIHDAFDGASTGTGYETLNLILTDNSNQFIQNAHNALALIFSFLTGNTLFFMYRQQETLYYALFEEVTALTSLIEQSALLSEGRDMYQKLLECITLYVEDDLKLVTDYKNIYGEDSSSYFSYVRDEMDLPREDLPALLLSRRPQHDPLEKILYLTSVGEASAIYATVKELRQARAKRLGALQRKMPEVNMYLLYVLGFTVWISFPVVTAGAQTVGGEALVEVFQKQLSLGVFAMAGLLGIINELKRPEIAGAYNIDYSLLSTLIDGIDKDLEIRIKRCEKIQMVDYVPTQAAVHEVESTESSNTKKRRFLKWASRFKKSS